VADALGLAIFTVVGAQKALQAEFSGFIAVITGMTTGVTGGIIRDVLCAKVPQILRREIYATASLAGGVVFVVLRCARAPEGVAAGVAVVVLCIRLAAIHWNLSLPVFQPRDDGE